MDKKTMEEKLAAVRQAYRHLLRCDVKVERQTARSAALKEIMQRSEAEKAAKVVNIKRKGE